MDQEKENVLVVGAGWAGLSAAVSLSAAGFKVTVLEAAPKAGGRARKISCLNENLDNGQHLLMGAYQKTLTLLKKLNILESHLFHRMPFNYYGIDRQNPQKKIQFNRSFFKMKGFSWQEYLQIARFLGIISRYRVERKIIDESVYDFLIKNNQSLSLIKKLWEPLALAALSTPIENASIVLFLNALKTVFEKKRNSDWLIPKGDLSEILPNPAIDYLNKHQGAILTHQRVLKLMLEEGRCVGVVTPTKTFRAKNIVLATPPSVTHDLLKAINHPFPTFEYQPITTVYLQYKVPVSLPYPMISLINAKAQWLFDRSLTGQPNILSIVMSGDGPHRRLRADTLVEELLQEVKGIFPRLSSPVDSRVICEKKGAFQADIGIREKRPGVETRIPGLWLAGDYTNTPYPATLEGAVYSGIKVFEAISLRTCA